MDFLALGLSQIIYDETQSNAAITARANLNNLYVQASWEQPKLKMMGQPLGDMDLWTAGVGYQVKIARGLSLRLEAGYAFPSASINDHIRDEVVYTQLVRDHFVANRPIPLVDLDVYETSYDVSGGVYGAVGLNYSINDHLGLTAAYRALQLDQEYTLRDPDPAALVDKYGSYGEGYWRQDTQVDLSGFSIGIEWRF